MAKILVVDDSSIAVRALRAALEEVGHEVTSTSSPFAFSHMLSTVQPDLALVDVNLPAITGDRLVQVARTHRGVHECPLVLYTALDPDRAQELVDQCGAAGFIHKSEGAAALVRKIEALLA